MELSVPELKLKLERILSKMTPLPIKVSSHNKNRRWLWTTFIQALDVSAIFKTSKESDLILFLCGHLCKKGRYHWRHLFSFMCQPEPHWLSKQRAFCSCGWQIWITKAMFVNRYLPFFFLAILYAVPRYLAVIGMIHFCWLAALRCQKCRVQIILEIICPVLYKTVENPVSAVMWM